MRRKYMMFRRKKPSDQKNPTNQDEAGIQMQSKPKPAEVQQLETDIDNIMRELATLKTDHPELESAITLHEHLIRTERRKYPRQFIDDDITRQDILENIINQHKKWKEIILTPSEPKQESIHNTISTAEQANACLAAWREKLATMPDIAETKSLQKQLLDTKASWERKLNIQYVQSFNARVHNQYDVLFHQIEAAKKLDQLKQEEKQAPVAEVKNSHAELEKEIINLKEQLNKIIEGLSQKKSLSSLEQTHLAKLKTQQRNIKRNSTALESQSLPDQIEILSTIIKRHKTWEEIIKTPVTQIPATKQRELYADEVNDYLSSLKKKIDEMPDIEEKIVLQGGLENIERLQQSNSGNLIPSVNQLKSHIDEKYGLLFEKIDMHQLTNEAKESIQEYRDMLPRLRKITTIDSDMTIKMQNLADKLFEALKANEATPLREILKDFNTSKKALLKMEELHIAAPPIPVPPPSAEAQKWIKRIETKIERIEAENQKDIAKGKTPESLLFRTHKIEVLKATIDYLNNKKGCDLGHLTKVRKGNNQYDKASVFRRSETKGLVTGAITLKTKEAALAAKKESKQNAPSTTNNPPTRLTRM